MKRLLKEIIGKNSLGNILGKILAVFSVVSLIKKAFDKGFAYFFSVVIDYYNKLINALFGWADPFLASFVDYLNSIFELNLDLLSHWKHILVLLNIYFLRIASINFEYGYKKTGVFAGISGFIISFLASIIIGSISLNELNLLTVFKALLIPIFAIFLFDVLRQIWIATFSRIYIAGIYKTAPKSWWLFFKPNLFFCIFQALGSIIIAGLFLLIPFVKDSRSPFLFSLGLLVICLSIYRVFLAIAEIPKLMTDDKSLITSFLRSSSAGVGLSMISLFFWLFIFLLLNAGLQFFGL